MKVQLEPGICKDVGFLVRIKDTTSFWDEN